ncbi:GNAT family N-acetyltransferase [Paenibacillus sp. SYP-B3998]|uniref:GNAT family N-acetyltransferase n=1 Tax=Paenibacillus sp. SYP-B3998 TaxID=2678564 RepID=A0A6G3ZW55_9BACL|nr:GNAT family N-acetyltransferase [Paenibacillus sp. SYP-B3998]NEW06443.1 GNAT family N-acetyltransferase [Paenibacillus sp. SYP-B3998]
MSETQNQFVTMDLIAARTWVAETTSNIGHWMLRSSQGLTKRANSVLAIGAYPDDADWLHKSEQFYRERSLPALFHVSMASPHGLDELLAHNGYELNTPCFFMTANSQDVKENVSNVLPKKKPSPLEIQWSEQADADWLGAYLRLEQYPSSRKAFYAGLFARMASPKGFVQLKHDGQAVAVGTAIVEADWSGFVNIVVSEGYRGQGIGYVLMGALTEWSMVHGASKQYLQVIADNEPALALYRKLGYSELYLYHYRIKNDL